MFKYFVVLAIIAAANASTIDSLINGRFINFSLRPRPQPARMDCSFWFNITDTHETTNCGQFTNVPILKFTADTGKTFTLPVITIEEENDMLKAMMSESIPCDTTVTNKKMTIMETDNHFFISDVMIVENGKKKDYGSSTFATSIPTKSELQRARSVVDFDNVICYEDDSN